jgi:hypothetical protein
VKLNSPEKISTSRFTLDHLQPRSLGGSDATAIGRATCDRLDMNDEKYQGERSIREARALWRKAGWHPPKHDPRQLET